MTLIYDASDGAILVSSLSLRGSGGNGGAGFGLADGSTAGGAYPPGAVSGLSKLREACEGLAVSGVHKTVGGALSIVFSSAAAPEVGPNSLVAC